MKTNTVDYQLQLHLGLMFSVVRSLVSRPSATTVVSAAQKNPVLILPSLSASFDRGGGGGGVGGGSSSFRLGGVEERDPKDRTRVIPVDIAIKYMDSAAYQQIYGDRKVWELYRRNYHKGKIWKDTRRKCIFDGRISTGSPCPICRDEYLVVDYRNLKLIKQFIKDYNGEILTSKLTGVCQEQWLRLRVAIEKAKDHGYLDIDPPFVEYDYELFKPMKNEQLQ